MRTTIRDTGLRDAALIAEFTSCLALETGNVALDPADIGRGVPGFPGKPRLGRVFRPVAAPRRC